VLPTPRGLLAAALLLAAHGAAAPPSVDGCSALVRREPRSLASYRCFWDLAHTGQRLPAERALEAILRRQPDNPGALMFLGLCRDERGLDARELLERAVAGFQRAGRHHRHVRGGSLGQCDRSYPQRAWQHRRDRRGDRHHPWHTPDQPQHLDGPSELHRTRQTSQNNSHSILGDFK